MIDGISKEDRLGRRLGWMIGEVEIQVGCLTPSRTLRLYNGPV